MENNTSPVMSIIVAMVAIGAILFVTLTVVQLLRAETQQETQQPVIDVDLAPESEQGSTAQ